MATFLSAQRPDCANRILFSTESAPGAVNHCFAHGIWDQASYRALKHQCAGGLLPLLDSSIFRNAEPLRPFLLSFASEQASPLLPSGRGSAFVRSYMLFHFFVVPPLSN